MERSNPLLKYVKNLKGCQSFELLAYVERGVRSFHTGNKGSAKLLAIKVGVLKKKSVALTITADVARGSGVTPPGFESLSKFDKWQLCSPLTYSNQLGQLQL